MRRFRGLDVTLNRGGSIAVARLVIVIGSCLFVLAAEVALAAPKVVVFPVVPLAGQVELQPAQQMTRAIMEEFKQQGEKVQTVEGQEPAAAVTAPDSGRKPAKSDVEYRAALGQLKEGAQQAQKLRFPQAIRALRKGIEGTVKNLDLLDDYNKLLDAYVLLAVAYFRKGQQSAGADVLAEVARLRPDLELDPGQYPPVFISVFDQARARALSRPRAGVRVTSAPAKAEVIVNGRVMGTTPLVVDELIPGEQHLVLKLGENVWSKAVEAREGDIVDVHGNLGAGGPDAAVTMGDAIAANRFDQEVRKTARQAGRNANADLVLVMAMGMGDRMYTLSSFLGNVKSGKWVAIKAVAPDLDLLSDSIEAHTLVRDVVTKLDAFDPALGDDTLAFVAGRPMATARRTTALKETHVAFVSPSLKVAATDRGPVQPVTRAPVASPQTAEPVVNASSGESGLDEGDAASRRPIGSRGPVSPTMPATRTTPTPEPVTRTTPVVVVPRRAEPPVTVTPVAPTPVTPTVVKPTEPVAAREPLRRGAAGRGPVVAGDLGIEIDDQPALVPVKGGTAAPVAPVGAAQAPDTQALVALTAPPAGSLGPLSEPNLEVEASMGSTPWYEEWWFWAAVGGAAVIVAGGATGTYVWWNNREPNSVTVYAVW